MATLTDADAKRLDHALTRLYAVVPFEEFPAHALEVARDLIGANNCSYNEIDVERGPTGC